MIGDKLTYHYIFQKTNNEIIKKLKPQFLLKKRICIAVGGESGLAKTSLACALFVDIENKLGLKDFLFHGDDYSFLPPKDNHNQRLEDNVNEESSEVNLKLLDNHIITFITDKGEIEKPLVSYKDNSTGFETIDSNCYDFCGWTALFPIATMYNEYIKDA